VAVSSRVPDRGAGSRVLVWGSGVAVGARLAGVGEGGMGVGTLDVGALACGILCVREALPIGVSLWPCGAGGTREVGPFRDAPAPQGSEGGGVVGRRKGKHKKKSKKPVVTAQANQKRGK